jgi:hypothetical protein
MSVAGPPLGRFLYEKSWTPVWGCYLNPLRFFGQAADYQSMDPNDYLEIVRVLDADETDVAITRGGGLFVRTDRLERTPEAVETVVRTFNPILCELAIRGVASHPVTDTDIQDGRLIDRSVAIAGGGGPHGEMSWAPLSLLASLSGDMGRRIRTAQRVVARELLLATSMQTRNVGPALNDFRTYTSAVQIELLATAGLITDDLAASLHTARKIRNDLVRRV